MRSNLRQPLERLAELDTGAGVPTEHAGHPARLVALRGKGWVAYLGNDRWQLTDRGRLQIRQHAHEQRRRRMRPAGAQRVA